MHFFLSEGVGVMTAYCCLRVHVYTIPDRSAGIVKDGVNTF